jgi:hypothetical protein
MPALLGELRSEEADHMTVAGAVARPYWSRLVVGGSAGRSRLFHDRMCGAGSRRGPRGPRYVREIRQHLVERVYFPRAAGL